MKYFILRSVYEKKILTDREQEVFELLIKNKTTTEIAKLLHISEKLLETMFQMQFKN